MSWTLSQLGFCAAADRGSRAAGRLLPAGHPSLWSFPACGPFPYTQGHSPPGPSQTRGLRPSLPCTQQHSPALVGMSRMQTSAHSSVSLHLPGFLLPVRGPGCGWKVHFLPQEPR